MEEFAFEDNVNKKIEEFGKDNEKIIEKRKRNLKKWLFGWVEDNYDKAFIGVLILAFALRIWVFTLTKDQAAWFDAAEYLSTAKKWAGIG